MNRFTKLTRATLLGSAAAALLVASPVSVGAQDFRFGTVVVEGNQRIETPTILSYLGVAQGEAVSAAELNEGAQRIRATGLFESVDVVPEGNRLVIRVTEFPTVYRISIEGNSRLDDAKLGAVLGTTANRVFNPATVEADVAKISDAYADIGRINATITPRIIRLDDNRVNVVFEVNESGVTEVERIGFTGNRTFGDYRLRGVLETKQAGILRSIIGRDTYVDDRIELDKRVLTDFYNSRGFVDFTVQDVDVSLTRGRDAYLITFNVEEGQQFKFGNVTVSSDLPEVDVAAFNAALKADSGDIYSPQAMETDIARLERLALQQGLTFVQVDPQVTRNDANQTLDVNFALVRGERIFIERIDIEGNNTTLDRVVRQQFKVVEGDPFNPRAIRESAERIRALGYLANADVNARAGSTEGQVVIDVNVQEAPSGSLTFGANYNTDGGFGLIGSFSENNFLGRGQGLDISISTAETNRKFDLTFSDPYVLGRDLRFTFDASYLTTDNENASYDTESFKLQPSITYPVSEYGRLTNFVALRYSNMDGYEGSVPSILQDQAEGGRWTTVGGYSYSWDTRRGGLDPNTGVLLRFGQEYATGDTQYIKTTALAAAETKVFQEEVTLRATVEGGMLNFQDGDSRILDRFFMSSRQMRGFSSHGIGPRYYDGADEDEPLGGNKYAVARLEAEFPLGLPEEYGITGGAYIDYGSVWDPGFECGADYYYCEFTPRAVAGLSIFWNTPIGPLRFNWSDPISAEEYDDTQAFDVTISTNF